MPTLQDYQNAAPTLSGHMTLEQIQNAFNSMPTEADPPEPPVITQEKKDDLFIDLTQECSVRMSIAKFGGFGALAKKHELSPQQIKTLCMEVESMYLVHNSQ